MPDPACATRPRDGPERRVVAVAPEWLEEFEAAMWWSLDPPKLAVDRVHMRELLRYVRALERERDEAGSFW